MKKAFTMIELVFVIVILGILASLAIPKLVATKDDAEVTKIVIEMKDAFNKVASYYISYNDLPAKLNKVQGDTGESSLYILMLIGDDPTLTNIEAAKSTAQKYPWVNQCFFIYYENESIKIKTDDIVPSDKLKQICNTLYTHPAVKEWMEKGIKIGGSAVFKE